MPAQPATAVEPASREPIAQLKAQLGRVILGKDEVIENLLIALLSGSHILMEDLPGVGKTTLAKALARSLSAEFKRIQFTPDLLPTDILGSSVYNPREGTFTFKHGPIFANILLADEINRASPRTQSSLLEAMSERQASIEGTTYPLPAPFLVIATQNPIEFHGTYPLPEAQLDRFGMKINLGYPLAEQEVDILFSQFHHHPLDDVQPIVDCAVILRLQAEVRAIRVDQRIARYIVDLASATRSHSARRGKPVVKEFQEEYFCRIALILDTFLPEKAGAREEQAFEAAISVAASVADYLSRGEHIVDILAAGPDIYEVSAGRSLAYLENILDVLACLEPCYQPPFQAIGPHLFEKLAQITTVVAVLGDWDQPRRDFLRRVKSLGTAVRAIVVHDGPTREPWQNVGEELGEISQMTPVDVERLLKTGARQGASVRA